MRPPDYVYPRSEALLGAPQVFALPSVTFFAAYQAWLVRNAEGFYALKAVCPHLGCKPDWQAATQGFQCPCHGSRFAADGALLAGPSLKPLERLPLRLHNNQLLLVLKNEGTPQPQDLFIPYRGQA